MKQFAAIALIIYGIILAGGGVMGYTQAKSHISLIMGLLFGGLAILAGIVGMKSPDVGISIGVATAAVVGGLFLYRYINTHKMMPAGMTLILSLLVLVFCIAALWNRE
jgi:uncharacterized membrane protein (UPF0136 family)